MRIVPMLLLSLLLVSGFALQVTAGECRMPQRGQEASFRFSDASPGDLQGDAVQVEGREEFWRSSRLLRPSLALASEEPNPMRRVEIPDWTARLAGDGDDTSQGVESSSSNRTYLRYVIPVAAIAAAGVTTYLLYTTRSR